jgi:Flp pilus assembly protein TadG
MRRPAERGATTIEMTLVGIPIIFLLISTFEISRGMWMYNTCATAVREGVRFATVHGVNCVNGTGVPNACEVKANDIVKVIRAGAGNAVLNSQGTSNNYGPTGAGAAGLDEVNTILTFNSTSGSFDCKLDGTSTGSCANRWPPDVDNGVKKVISVSVKTPFYSALSMFWPGSAPVKFGVVNLWASSSDTVQF